MMWVRCATRDASTYKLFHTKSMPNWQHYCHPATPAKKHHLTGYDRFWWKSQHQPFPLTSRWFSQSFNSISCCIHVDQRDLRTRGDFASHRPPEVRWRCAGNQFAIRGYHDIQARLKWPSIRVSLCWLLPQDTTCFSKYGRTICLESSELSSAMYCRWDGLLKLSFKIWNVKNWLPW